MIRKKSRPRRQDSDGASEEAFDLPEVQKQNHESGDRLIEPPGAPKRGDADAVGEGNVEELAQETEGKTLEERTENAQRERARATSQEPPPRRANAPGE